MVRLGLSLPVVAVEDRFKYSAVVETQMESSLPTHPRFIMTTRLKSFIKKLVLEVQAGISTMKTFVYFAAFLTAFTTFGANPSFQSFNGTQFGTNNNSISIAPGVPLTNVISQGLHVTGGGSNFISDAPATFNAAVVDNAVHSFNGIVSATNVGNQITGTFTGNGGGLTNIAYTNLINRLLFANLRDFGAKGDGTTDDTTAVQAWSTYGTANNLNLYAPAGNYKLTSTPTFAAPAGNGGLTTVSWRIWGDGVNLTQFFQTSTNNHCMSFPSGISGLDIEHIQFKGVLTGANAVSSCGLYVPTGVANNGNTVRNCNFVNLYCGLFIYLEDSIIDTCTFQDNIIGGWLPNTSVGYNNSVWNNCVFPEGPLSLAIATNGVYQQIGIRIDAGGGHIVSSASFNFQGSNAIGFQSRGGSVDLIGDYAEMNGAGKFIDLEGDFNQIQCRMRICPAITGGSGFSTNLYPVVCSNAILSLDGYQSLAGWSSKSQYKQIDGGTGTAIEYNGYAQQFYADEYNSAGVYQNTHLLTFNPLFIASSTATNTISPNGQTQVVNGVQNHSVDSQGTVFANAFTASTTVANNRPYGFEQAVGYMQFNGGANGYQFNDTGNTINIVKILNAGGFEVQTGTLQADNNEIVAGNVFWTGLSTNTLAFINVGGKITTVGIGPGLGIVAGNIVTNGSGGGGSGTVTSVTFTGNGVVDSASPSTAVTTSGTIAATILSQTSNTFLAGPTSGSAAAPTFRAINSNDLINVNGSGLTNLQGTNIAGFLQTNTQFGSTNLPVGTNSYNLFKTGSTATLNAAYGLGLNMSTSVNGGQGAFEFYNVGLGFSSVVPLYGAFQAAGIGNITGDASALTGIPVANAIGTQANGTESTNTVLKTSLTTNGITSLPQTFTVGTPWTNNTGFNILTSDLTVSYNEALVAGACVLKWTVSGTNGTTNNIQQVTVALIGSSTGTMSNAVPSIAVANGAILSFTDGSTGTGNSVTLPLQGKINYVQQLSVATSTNFVGNGAGLTNLSTTNLLYSFICHSFSLGTSDQFFHPWWVAAPEAEYLVQDTVGISKTLVAVSITWSFPITPVTTNLVFTFLTNGVLCFSTTLNSPVSSGTNITAFSSLNNIPLNAGALACGSFKVSTGTAANVYAKVNIYAK
jgi:hypothetical protein